MIGILIPMPQEIALLITHMQHTVVTEIGMRKYYHGSLYGVEVVLAQSRIGKVASATTATAMIHQFNISTLIVTGVAGGVAESAKIGDICIASAAVQHDMDARGLFPQFEIPLLNKIYFETSTSLLDKAYVACQAFINDDFANTISIDSLEQFKLYGVSVHVGLLASGDQFIGSLEKSNQLQSSFPELIFVEMEGAAVAQVAFEYGIDVINIRVISDNANDTAHVDFDAFVNSVAKFYTAGFIKNILQELV